MKIIARPAWCMLLLLVSQPVIAADQLLLRIAITTTTDNSGLMKVLIPAFESKTHYTTHVLAVGTGKALRLLANGDVDVAITHAPALEIALLDAGDALDRRQFMFNDFVLVGPQGDPAAVSAAASIETAFRRIHERHVLFVSRGDGSGTHEREKSIWQNAGVVPIGDWYRATGQGMGQTIAIATELDGYTLTDRGTWLAYSTSSGLAVLYQGDERLLNIYSAMAGNPDLHPDLNHAGAIALIRWLLSNVAATLIRDFRIDGQQLYVPLLVATQAPVSFGTKR